VPPPKTPEARLPFVGLLQYCNLAGAAANHRDPAMTNDPQSPENRERARSITHRLRDRFSTSAIWHGRMRFWFFLVVVAFIIAILIFGVSE
jgi:hypothetical protein